MPKIGHKMPKFNLNPYKIPKTQNHKFLLVTFGNNIAKTSFTHFWPHRCHTSLEKIYIVYILIFTPFPI